MAKRPDLVAELAAIDEADLPCTLGRHLTGALERALKGTRDPARQVNLVATLLELVEDLDEMPEVPPEILKSLITPTAFGALARSTTHPSTPLSEAALLTNAPGEPQLGSELRKELLTAGGVDRNAAMRQEHQSEQIDSSWSLGSPSLKGDAITIATEQAGADTAFMDESWWFRRSRSTGRCPVSCSPSAHCPARSSSTRRASAS